MKPPELTDGIVRLRALRRADAAAHLAGEDDELWRWMTQRAATLAMVEAFIERNLASWRDDGPVRNFGIWDEATGELAGNCEANIALDGLPAGAANISYAIWPTFRGRGYATRAVRMLCDHLAHDSDCTTAIVRVEPANIRSVAVAHRCGFTEVQSPEPRYLRFTRSLR